MKSLKWLALGAALMLGSCQSVPQSITPYQLSAAEITAVKAGVAGSLKDPYSAMFGPRFAAARLNNDASITVCGMVNAKNSFGGYVGAAPFIGHLLRADFPGNNGTPRFVVDGLGGPSDEYNLVGGQCSRDGLYPG